VDTINELFGAVHHRPPETKERAIGVVDDDSIHVSGFEQFDSSACAARERLGINGTLKRMALK